MSSRLPPLTPQRLARLIRWARLWLTWLSGVLVFLMEHFPERANRLTYVGARAVAHLIFVAAAQKLPVVKGPRRYGKTRSRRHLRPMLGKRLRRAYVLRDPVARFFAALEMLRDFDEEVARFRRRARKGLSRRCSRAYAWANEALTAPPVCVIAAADSS